MTEKEVEKRIQKIISKYYKDDNKNLKLIKKYFGGINFKFNGNSLYHLFIQYSKTIREVDKIIFCLIRNGLDVNLKNNNGKTFLQLVIDKDPMYAHLLFNYETIFELIDLNSVDNNGRTILHNLLYSKAYLGFSRFYKGIEKNAKSFDFTIRDNQGFSVYDLVDKIFTDYQAGKECFHFDLYLYDCARDAHIKNFITYANQLTDDPNVNFNILYNAHIFAEDLIYEAQAIPDDNFALLTTKRLLITNYRKNKVSEKTIDLVLNTKNIDYILHFFELVSTYEDFKMQDLMLTALSTIIDIDKIINLFVKVQENGYSNEEFKEAITNGGKRFLYKIITNTDKNLIKNIPIEIVDDYDTEALYNLCLLRSTYSILTDLFDKNNLNYDRQMFDDSSLINFINIEVSTFQNLLNINNYYELCTAIVEKIIDKKTIIINENNVIQKSDIKDALREIIINATNKKFDKQLTKTMSGVNNGKN